MDHTVLERHQVWVYLAAILVGLAAGVAQPTLTAALELLVLPTLGILLYATFTQVPLGRLPEAMRDRRFIAAVLRGNFAIIPIIVGGLVQLLPPDQAVRLGVLLVLLVPCTDWFITFAALGGGDARRAIVATPLNLLLQLMLLPLYLTIIMGRAEAAVLVTPGVVTSAIFLIVLPLVLAFLTQRWSARETNRAAWVEKIGFAPIPLLAGVVFLIAASQVNTVIEAVPAMGHVLAVFLAYLLLAALAGTALARLLRLTAEAGRTLVFSMGTRNSFVVLPVALALPETWQAAAVVVVFQSLVELFGMTAYLRIVPHVLSKNRTVRTSV